VVDGDTVPQRPIDAIRAGASHGVDVLAGNNADDWRMFGVLGGQIDRVTDDVLRGPVERHGFLSIAAYGLAPDDALAAYRAMHPHDRPDELLAEIQTDWWCRIPAMRLAEARDGAAGATYLYEFAWPSPVMGGRLGACHALEVPFVFDTLDLGPRQLVGGLLGEAPPRALATEMHRAWVRFASTGDPGWPPYDTEQRPTMRFGAESTVVDDPHHAERAFWQGAM
jgi:para-nitrobenzyl esterase